MAADLPEAPVARNDFDYYGGRTGGLFVGLLYGLPIVVVAWVVIGVVRLLTGRRFLNRRHRDIVKARM